MISIKIYCSNCQEQYQFIKNSESAFSIKCEKCGNILLDFSPINGYLYILSNPSMPNLLKIGFTTRNVDERITELNSSTGVPTNFVLEAYFCSSTPENDERLLHRELNEYRTNRNREFFQISILDAIEKIKNILEKPPDLLGENGQAEFQQKEIKRQEEIKKRENISSYIYANDPGGNIVKYSILCVSCGKQFFSSQLVHGSTKCPHCFKTYNNRICLL